MADPVGKLDILVDFDLDKSSLDKISKQVQSFHKSLQKMANPIGGNKDLQTFLPSNIRTIGKEYQKLTSSLKKTYGFNDKQVKTIVGEYLKKDESNNIGYKLAQQAGIKNTKKWTLKEFAAKEPEYQRLKSTFAGQGLSGGEVIAKLENELGFGYIQERGRRKEELGKYLSVKEKEKEEKKAYKLLGKETKLKQKGLPFLKELGNLKGFSKGLLGVGFAGGVATLAGKMISSYVGGQISKVEDFGTYGTLDLSAMKKSMTVIGGSGWSGEAIEKALTSSFDYMTGKVQNIQTLGSDLAQMGIVTGGRGSKYLTEYSNLIAEGYSDGTPKFREIMELSDKISRDSNLTKADQRALISQMTGSSEIAEKLMTNADIEGKSLVELNKKNYPAALAGITQGKKYKKAAQSLREKIVDMKTQMNLSSELQNIIEEAGEKVSKDKDISFWDTFWSTEKFNKRRDQYVKEGIDEKSALIPALQETYRKEASLYGVTPIVNIENNFNVSSDYDAERAGDIVTDSINVNLKNSQEFD